MIDAVDLEIDDRLAEMLQYVVLVEVAVGGDLQSRRARLGEMGGELDRRMAFLIGIQADADQLRDKDDARGNRLHPYYLIYVDQHGEVVADHTEAKHLLDLLRAGCRPFDEPVPEAVAAFNAATAEGAEMGVYSQLLTDAISSMIELNDERDIDSLFTPGMTTALKNTIAGLDDFELIAFIAVLDPAQAVAHD